MENLKRVTEIKSERANVNIIYDLMNEASLRTHIIICIITVKERMKEPE